MSPLATWQSVAGNRLLANRGLSRSALYPHRQQAVQVCVPVSLRFPFKQQSALPSTHSLTPWCRVLLEKLTGFQLVKKFSEIYGTRRFITAFTSAGHLSLSWASSIQSIPPHPTSWRSILILSHLRLGLPSGLFPSCIPTKTLYKPPSSPIRATRPTHLILLDFIARKILGEEYRSLSSSLCSFLQSAPHT